MMKLRLKPKVKLMWIKRLADGTVFYEAPKKGHTWTKTPLKGLIQVSLLIDGQDMMTLEGYPAYWHSRRAVAFEGQRSQVIAERIQGQREDGLWDTIEWNGKEFRQYVADQAFGKPVVK